MTDVGRKAITQVKQAAIELLTHRLPAEQASALADKLSTGTWTHDYPIWASTGKSLGLSISADMPNKLPSTADALSPTHSHAGRRRR
jgi:hypothetical protein